MNSGPSIAIRISLKKVVVFIIFFMRSMWPNECSTLAVHTGRVNNTFSNLSTYSKMSKLSNIYEASPPEQAILHGTLHVHVHLLLEIGGE